MIDVLEVTDVVLDVVDETLKNKFDIELDEENLDNIRDTIDYVLNGLNKEH